MNGRKYWYNTPNDGRRVIGVMQVNAPGNWGVCYLGSDNRPHVVRTPNLPQCQGFALAQRALDIFAAWRGLEEVPAERPGCELPQGCGSRMYDGTCGARPDEVCEFKIFAG